MCECSDAACPRRPGLGPTCERQDDAGKQRRYIHWRCRQAFPKRLLDCTYAIGDDGRSGRLNKILMVLAATVFWLPSFPTTASGSPTFKAAALALWVPIICVWVVRVTV